MVVFGRSLLIMAIGVGIFLVTLVASIAVPAIANFGPLSIPRRSDHDKGAQMTANNSFEADREA
jgi:hypothetical protein